jgi:hypothetical protein
LRIGLTLFVVTLNVLAIVSVLGARRSAGRKAAWLLTVLLLPLVGAAAWLVLGRRYRSR